MFGFMKKPKVYEEHEVFGALNRDKADIEKLYARLENLEKVVLDTKQLNALSVKKNERSVDSLSEAMFRLETDVFNTKVEIDRLKKKIPKPVNIKRKEIDDINKKLDALKNVVLAHSERIELIYQMCGGRL